MMGIWTIWSLLLLFSLMKSIWFLPLLSKLSYFYSNWSSQGMCSNKQWFWGNTWSWWPCSILEKTGGDRSMVWGCTHPILIIHNSIHSSDPYKLYWGITWYHHSLVLTIKHQNFFILQEETSHQFEVNLCLHLLQLETPIYLRLS